MASENNYSPDNAYSIYCDNDSNSKSSFDEALSQQDIFESTTKEERQARREKNSKTQNFFVPAIAVPEKIVLCIDTSPDKGISYSFTGLNQDKTESSSVRNEALRVFMTNKLAVASDTEFAVASLEQGKFNWLSPFSSNIGELTKSLPGSETKYKTDNEDDSCDITPIFSNVLDLVDIPVRPKSKALPPNYLIRIIFVYNNSYIPPVVVHSDEAFTKFCQTPYCVFDVLYLHEAQSDFNNVQKIYGCFGQMITARSYLFECSKDVTKVFNSMAKLLAHPYQRVNQQLWEF